MNTVYLYVRYSVGVPGSVPRITPKRLEVDVLFGLYLKPRTQFNSFKPYHYSVLIYHLTIRYSIRSEH